MWPGVWGASEFHRSESKGWLAAVRDCRSEPVGFESVADRSGCLPQHHCPIAAPRSFSPCGESLFIGLSEPMFGGMLEFQRHCGRFDPWGG